MVTLLNNKGANVVGDPVYLGSTATGNSLYPARVVAVGGFTTQKVTIEYSPTTSQDDWISLGDLADKENLIITAPVERVRAKTAVGMTGNATVYLLTVV